MSNTDPEEYGCHMEDYGDPVYYRLYYNSLSKYITVIEMQSFDEYGYKDSQFVRNSRGDKHKFNSKDAAIDALNSWYSKEDIDPKFVLEKERGFFVRDF
jgi:hypothetical protein